MKFPDGTMIALKQGNTIDVRLAKCGHSKGGHSAMKVKRCIDEILKSGLDDWVDAAEVVSIAIEDGGAGTDRERRELSLRLIREVLERGWMRIGDLTKDGFRAWALSMPEAMERIQREWDSLEQGMPSLGDICWLEITETGRDLAKEFYRRDAGEDQNI